jgi:hypothetical protein
MKLSTGILLLSAGLGSGVLAEEPKAPPVHPVAAQTPAPSASSSPDAAKLAPVTAATTPAKTDTSEMVNVAATEALIKRMRGRGYKPINRNGILVFCRSEGQLGSHFERTRCNTLDELRNAELTGREYTQQIQQQGSPTPFKSAGAEH